MAGFRGLIVLIVSLASAVAADAQQTPKVPKIGYLSNSGGHSVPDSAFLDALRKHGYIEGNNVIVEARYSAGRSDRFSEFSADLVQRGVQVIAAWSPTAVGAAKKATDTVPIVGISMGSDPVGLGWASSLARPGGNVTGFVSGDVWLNAKRIELLKEAFPSATRVAVLANPTNPSFAQEIGEADKAARALRIQTDVLGVSDPAALPKVFADAVNRQVNALLVVPDGMLWAHRGDIVKLAAQKRLPAMYWTSDYTEAGGLVSYAESLNDLGIRAAEYVDRILKGAKPGDLPIQEPVKFELIVNLKTAKTLSLSIAPSPVGRADRIIE
jgi:ABC-type uncharacterized transport system substrate-binding protein